MFKDQVTIQVQGGRGGDGSMSFRREKYAPRGGPDGGDGGRGGDVIIKAKHGLRTLSNFIENQKFVGESGTGGSKRKQHGKAGEHLTVKVPIGTQVHEVVSSEQRLLADLSEDGAEIMVARGGKGGLGNVHFVTSVNQAPKVADLGQEGEHKRLFLELKLLADVGIIGLPNAGKSTLLAALTQATPKIANYPFTTLDPNLGIVTISQGKNDYHAPRLVLADIPGLIEGAAGGKGLGHKFLRHVERTRLLLHIIDCSSGDAELINQAYTTVNQELEAFNALLAAKQQVIVFNKVDELDEEMLAYLQSELASNFADLPHCYIAAGYGEGLEPLIALLWQTYTQVIENTPLEPLQKAIFRPTPEDSVGYTITHVDEVWRVRGKKVESIIKQTRLETEGGLMRMFDLLKRQGVIKELEDQGIEPGDAVEIAGFEFTWE